MSNLSKQLSLDQALAAIELAVSQGDENAAMLLEIVAQVEHETADVEVQVWEV